MQGCGGTEEAVLGFGHGSGDGPQAVGIFGTGCAVGEGTSPEQLAQANQGDIPYHMMSCSAIKAGVMKEEGWDIQADSAGLARHYYT